MTQAQVQIIPDGTGKKVRTLEITVGLPDGTQATVEMQVMAIADKSGNLIHLDNAEVISGLADVRDEIYKLRSAFEAWSGMKGLS